MAELVFNLRGYVFQDGLARIRESYASADDAICASSARARDEAFTYQQSLEMGGEWIGDRDEDGIVIWSQEDIHELTIDNAHASLMSLRKAYVLAAYHHWERSARIWTGNPKVINHEELAAAVTALGYPLHPHLGAVRDLANALKHNNGRWGMKLLTNHPGLLTVTANEVDERTDWYEAITLSEAAMSHLFEVVAQSGPDADTVPPSA